MIGRLAVAAVTLTAGLAGWLAMDKIWPSSPRLFRMAVQEAESGNFRNAVELIGRASSARGHVNCEERRKTFAQAIPAWQTTVVAWEFAQEELEHGQWISARKSLSQTVRWDWNADDALRQQCRAQAVSHLLDSFLSMRDAISSPEPTAEQLAKSLDAWRESLAQAEAEPSMADEVWTNSFNAVFSQRTLLCMMEADSLHRNVWMPLRDAGATVAEEIRISLEEYNRFQTCLERLSVPDLPILSRPAAACADEIHALWLAIQNREKARMAGKEGVKRENRAERVLRCSPLLENRYNRIREALDDLAAAEAAVARNLETIAALEPGWERQLEKDLDFPTHTDEPAVLAYQRLLATTNAHLCMKVASQLKNTHLAKLAEMGMEEPDRVPEAVARVMKPETMDEILRFVDFTQPPRKWMAGGVLEGCAYDELLGCEYVCEFLGSHETGGEDFLEDHSPSKEESACPVARQAREDFIGLWRFLDFIAREPLLADAAALKRLGSGKPNKLGQYRQKAESLLEKRKDMLAEWKPETGAKGRAGVAAKVLYLMLETDRWNEELLEMHKAAHDEDQRLFKVYVTAARMRRGDEEYLRNCVPDSFWFKEWREYAEDRSARRRP